MKSFPRMFIVGLLSLGASLLTSQAQLIQLNAGAIDTGRAAKSSVDRAAAATSGNQLRLVQFDGPIQPEWVAQLTAAGFQVVDYIPENAYLVYGGSAAVQSVRTRAKHVKWEGAYLASDKINPKARPEAAKARRALVGEDDLFAVQLVLDEEANAATVALLSGLAKEPLLKNNAFRHYRNIVVRMEPAEVATIAARPDVISIAPYVVPKKLDERQGMIVAGQLSGNGPSGPGYLAWLAGKGFTQQQFTTSGLLVDVCDSGMDNGTNNPNHFGLYTAGNTALASRVVYNRLEGTPNSGSTLQGCDGHGTLNSHIIGGYNDRTGGFPHQDSAGYRYGLGIAPFVKLGSSVIFDSDNFTTPDYEDMISRAYRDGARISSDSWGADTYGGYDIDCQQYDALVRDAQQTGSAVPVAGNQGMTIVFAAGNAGSGAGTVGSPGTAKNVITVGATENVHSHAITNGGNSATGADGCDTPDAEANSVNDIATFSSRGPCSDGRKKPEIVAPGTHITGGVAQEVKDMAGNGNDIACFAGTGVCALPGGGTVGSTNNFFPLGQQWYSTSSGTSHSTPAVAGGAALVYQYFLNQTWNAPSPAMVKAYLMNAARYMDGADAGDDLWSNNQGMGMMNLDFAFDGVPRVLRDQESADTFTASGQSRAISGLVVDSGKPVRISLSWTDAPGSTSGNSYNNNLNLSVTTGGKTYLGNVFNGSVSTNGGVADAKNNSESVFLPAGTTGAVTVVVTAANINSDGVPNVEPALDQDYALVIYNFDEVEMPVVMGEGSALVAESCGVTGNAAIDPDETVTVDFVLRNAGSADTTNVMATLLATGGVVSPDGPHSYGALLAGGAPVTNSFTFAATGECGGTLTATLALEDNGVDLGAAVFEFTLGGTTENMQSKTNGATITLVDNASASPYPSTITISGMAGTISKVTATLRGFGHAYPEDVDVVLVSPDGQTVSLMGAAGGGTSVSGATLTFDDDAAGVLGAVILSGTYLPSGMAAAMNSPAPAPPYGAAMADLNGGNPNGDWKLYALDAAATDSGSIAQGWAITVTASEPLCCGSNKPPVFAALGNQSIIESNALIFAVTATDPYDGDPITLTASNLPAGSTFPVTNGLGTFIWESPEPTGTYAVSFFAEDKDGTVEKSISITVNPTPFVDTNCHVIVSEYVEGTSNTKALEIYNPTADAIDLTADGYVVQIYANGSFTPNNTINLTGTIPSQDVYVLAHSSSVADVLAAADQTSSSLGFNGNDAVVLRIGGTNGTVLDCIGQVGNDPGTEWGTGLTSTADNTLRRKTAVKIGDTVTSDAFDPATEWDGYANGTYDGLGAHTSDCSAPPLPTPPILNPVGNKSVTVSNNLQFQVVATPTESDAVTLTASNLPAGSTFNATNENGTFEWINATPTGVYSVTFYAADDDGTDEETITIAVNEPGFELLAPVIQAASDVQANQFNANWLASVGAAGYRLDVATASDFSAGGGGGGAVLEEAFASLTDTTHPSGWTGSGSSDLDYSTEPYVGAAAPAYKLKTTGQWLTSPAFAAGATNLQFWAYGNGAGTASTFAISGLVNSVWTLLDTVPIAISSATYNVALPLQTTQIRFNFTKNGYNCALDDVLVSGGGGTSSFVPGYENRDVGDVTTFAVTGLTESVTYYYRARAYTVSSNSPYSATTNVTTAAGVNVPPVLGAIGNRSVTVGGNLLFLVAATPTDADAVTLTASNLPAGATFNATNENGTFEWITAAPTGVYSVTFYAADDDGADEETISITVGEAVVELLAPVIQAADGVQTEQFNANWLASANATGYRLDVGTNDTFTGGGGGGQSVLASNAATSPALITGDWSGVALGGTTYVQMTNATAEIISAAFSTAGFTNLTVDFRARTFGGTTKSNITISISTNNGAAWTVLGVRNPLNGSTFSTIPTLTDTANLGHAQTRIRWQSLDAGAGVGVGVSNLIVQGWSSGGAGPAYVPGYENRDVANVTTFAVTGLTESVTYYYRVLAYNVSSNSPYSAVTSVVTTASSGTPPVLGAIGNQSVFLGGTLQFEVSASLTEGDAVTLTASNLPSGSVFNPTNELGTFLWTSASPTGLYSVTFNAADNDGADAETIDITVHPLPQMGGFVMSNGTPASATFPSVSGRNYQMQYSSNIWENPVLWNEVDSDVGTGGNLTLADTNTLIDIKRYYRIVIP